MATLHKRKQQKVIKMKKRAGITVGLIFLALSVYIGYVFVLSLTKKHVSIYEVVEKSVSDNDTIRGIILRNESLITTSKAGYINYYVGEGQKVGKTTNIYSIDESGDVYNELNDKISDIDQDSDDIADIRNDISSFRNSYESSDFSTTYNFKYSLENTIEQLKMTKAAEQLTKILKENTSNTSFDMEKATKSGIISYISDGKEDLSMSTISESNFTNMSDDWTQIRSDDSVNAGDVVYKLITDENWSIVVKVTLDQFTQIQKQNPVTIILKKNDISIVPDVSTFTIGDGYYVKFDLKDYMIQYLNDRYIDIQINLNDADGLKIPISSIIKKKVYSVPEAYLTKNKYNDNCVITSYTDTSDNTTANNQLKTVRIYDKTDDGNYLIDASDFKENENIYLPTNSKSDLSSTYTLSSSKTIEGVYNCNNGYCKFNIINKIYQNSEYAIVKKNTVYGLSIYDHIILNANLVKDEEILY